MLSTALAITPTPRVCPTPDPRNATVAPTRMEATCAELFLSPPSPPTFVVAVAVDGAIEVQWYATGSGTHYEVYRQIAPRGDWIHLANVATVPDRESPAAPNRATPYAWRDMTITSGVTYRYAVGTISAYGVPSGDAQASLPITAP